MKINTQIQSFNILQVHLQKEHFLQPNSRFHLKKKELMLWCRHLAEPENLQTVENDQPYRGYPPDQLWQGTTYELLWTASAKPQQRRSRKPAQPAMEQGQHTSGLKMASCGPFILLEAAASSLLSRVHHTAWVKPGLKG